jgi:mannosyltransferase
MNTARQEVVVVSRGETAGCIALGSMTKKDETRPLFGADKHPAARAFALGLIAIAICVGGWIRIAGLADESLWHDEAHSALMARLGVVEIVQASATADNNPPLYYLILYWFTGLMGADSESWLRAPSVIFGILGIWGTFLAAKEIGGPIVGLWAAALVALSVFHVQYSREARMYTLLYAAATLNVYLFLRLRAGKTTTAVLWAVCAVTTLFAHTVGLFVVLAQHVCWAVLRVLAPESVPTFRRWLTVNAAVALAAAPWAWVALQQQRRMGGVFWVPPPYLSQPLDVLAHLAGSYKLLVALLALAGVGCVALIRGVQPMTTGIRGTAALLVLVIWGGVPLLAPWLASYVSVPIFLPRITIACLAPLVIGAALGLRCMRLPWAITGGALVLAMSGQMAWQHTHQLRKENWRALAAYVKPQLRSGDLLLFHEGSRRKGFDYYVRDPVSRIAGFPDHRFTAGQTVQADELPQLDRLTEGHQRIWLVLASSNDPEQLIEHALSATRLETDRRDFNRLTVVRFDAPKR